MIKSSSTDIINSNLQKFWFTTSSLQELKKDNGKNIFYTVLHRNDGTDKAYFVEVTNLWPISDDFLNNKRIYKWKNNQIDVSKPEIIKALNWL